MSLTRSKTSAPVRYDFSLLGDHDLYLFNEGNHYCLYEKLGAHLVTVDGIPGTYFAVWAPDAKEVSVTGDFNFWNRKSHYLSPRGSSGIWEGFIPEIGKGSIYKFHIESRFNHYSVDKADPYAIFSEVAPKTGSIVWDRGYQWNDAEWMKTRRERNGLNRPTSVYEVHLGSWMRVPEEGNRSLSYRELAVKLVEYVKHMGFTHVEFMPVMEHPFFGSWGYQVTGFFAPTSRYGTPQDLMFLIDEMHQAGVGVILDWVPSHFPSDEHGLAYFEGTHLYEHADPRKGYHPDWNSYIFNYGRNEVRSFLMSSGAYWLNYFHADGLRVDAVASMLYLDYSRKAGEWIPNEYGGRENLEAVRFLRRFNEAMYAEQPDIQTAAEESTSWPMVSRPTYLGGLGFGMKWDMGWMHDTLKYMALDPVYRQFHHNSLSFRMLYAFNENFILPLSHDEVVHGKGSLVNRMAGDDWQKFANLRALFGYMYAQPGKKLIFMGGEFAQRREWNHDSSLDWHLLQHREHAGMRQWVTDLNRMYRSEPALYERDMEPSGFEWVDASDSHNSVISFIRKGSSSDDLVLFVVNLTPIVRYQYRVGVPRPGKWHELLNSDAEQYSGSGQGNMGVVEAGNVSWHGHHFSLSLTLPPLGCVFLKSSR
ncbi:MAG TPA: 1,4-alpha-glucan branching protein GlgB [Terriglobales bacterium]|nr:1,4-alpha-glucan branching protein GlgB [Terriglobales bacterium]